MPRPQHSRRASRPSQPETSPGDIASSTGRAAGSSSLGRVTKRSTNACSRCRRQKIRCSGLIPCDACTRRKLPCEINDSEQKILVTRGYIEDLQARIAALEEKKPAAASDIIDFGSDVDAGTQSRTYQPRFTSHFHTGGDDSFILSLTLTAPQVPQVENIDVALVPHRLTARLAKALNLHPNKIPSAVTL